MCRNCQAQTANPCCSSGEPVRSCSRRSWRGQRFHSHFRRDPFRSACGGLQESPTQSAEPGSDGSSFATDICRTVLNLPWFVIPGGRRTRSPLDARPGQKGLRPSGTDTAEIDFRERRGCRLPVRARVRRANHACNARRALLLGAIRRQHVEVIGGAEIGGKDLIFRNTGED